MRLFELGPAYPAGSDLLAVPRLKDFQLQQSEETLLVTDQLSPAVPYVLKPTGPHRLRLYVAKTSYDLVTLQIWGLRANYGLCNRDIAAFWYVSESTINNFLNSEPDITTAMEFEAMDKAALQGLLHPKLLPVIYSELLQPKPLKKPARPDLGRL